MQFAYEDTLDTDLNLFPNKDVVFFPEVVSGPNGVPSYAMLHRPVWDFSFVRRVKSLRCPLDFRTTGRASGSPISRWTK